MRFYYYSDLHNDLEDVLSKEERRMGKTRVFYPPEFKDEKKSILILAGDIDEIKKNENTRLTKYLEECSNRFLKVIYILGNHEYYKSQFNSALTKLKSRSSHIKNLHILNNETLEIGNVTVIGSTLWTDFNSHDVYLISKATERSGLRDFKKIKMKSLSGYRSLHPTDVIKEFFVSKTFVFKEIEKAKNKGNIVIVITHHAPSLKSCLGTEFDGAYGTNLENEIADFFPDFWIHGHVHQSHKYVLGKTVVLCNPRGYYPSDVNDEFDENAFFEVK